MVEGICGHGVGAVGECAAAGTGCCQQAADSGSVVPQSGQKRDGRHRCNRDPFMKRVTNRANDGERGYQPVLALWATGRHRGRRVV